MDIVLCILWWFLGFAISRHILLMFKPNGLKPKEVIYCCFFGLAGPLWLVVGLMITGENK